MISRTLLALAIAAVMVPGPAVGQTRAPDLAGTWRVATPEGPKQVVVRPDSSASFGDETVRWRIIADTIFIAFGEEWVGYNYTLRGDSLTFSGGDLEEPIALRRLGPATPRPAGVPLPAAPPFQPRTDG
jgi:hypothetical protein